MRLSQLTPPGVFEVQLPLAIVGMPTSSQAIWLELSSQRKNRSMLVFSWPTKYANLPAVRAGRALDGLSTAESVVNCDLLTSDRCIRISKLLKTFPPLHWLIWISR